MRRFCVGVIGLWALCLLFMPASANADLGNSDVRLMGEFNCYVPGETTKICFLVTNDSPDVEEINAVNLLCPTGWTLAFNSQYPTDVLELHGITDNAANFWP